MKYDEIRLPLNDDWSDFRRALLLWSREIAFAATRASVDSGTTADRPTSDLWTGRTYFDTTLGQPIWYDGSGWVDATGTTA